MNARHFLLLVLFLIGFSPALLQSASAAAPAASVPSKSELEIWRKATATPPTAPGCYQVTYPSKSWVKMDCGARPAVPPRTPPLGALAKGGKPIRPNVLPPLTGDWTMTPAQNITSATGRVITLTNVTSAGSINSNNGQLSAGLFSLQINSNKSLSGKAASGKQACGDGKASTSCKGWIQFVYNNNRQLYIQYWYINYLTSTAKTCPASLPLNDLIPGTRTIVKGTTGLDCGNNAVLATLSASAPSDFTKMQGVTLQAQALSNGNVAATLTSGTTAYVVTGTDDVGAATSWNAAEFNIFGFGANASGVFTTAQLNLAARITLGLTSDNDTSGTAPGCNSGTTTNENSNLDLGPCQATATPTPGIWFNESPSTFPLTSITPAQGLYTGGTDVQVYGGPFNRPFQIEFVTSTAAPAQIVTPINTLTNQITVVSPPGILGTPAGVSAAYIFANGVAGPFSAPQPFSYYNAPNCINSIFCPFYQNNPPDYTVTCPTPSDIYTTDNSNPPDFYPQALNVTSFTGTTTDAAVGLAACEPGSRTDCKFFSISVPVSNWCHGLTPPPPPPTCGQCGSGKCCPDPYGGKGHVCVPLSSPCPPLQ